MELETVELFIDEEKLRDGVEAISLVEFPAIEENFVALSQHKVEFKTLDEDKRVVVGLALVPDKKILRKRERGLYNIVFSKETVRLASELYLKRLKNNNATLEHEVPVDGVSVIESWIVEDASMDKSNLYGLNAVEGAWVVKMKIDNNQTWKEVKEGKYLGFSIEAFFSDREEEFSKDEQILEEVKSILNNLK
tara:strand:- start:1549 stop:2127 length:579 start_codon:yes stop_codon:yes gene_type:complete